MTSAARRAANLAARRVALALAWSSLLTAMFWIVFAATIALAVGTRHALIGIALSVAVYGAINGVLSAYAARTGLTVALLSRSMFGFHGASLATAIFAAGAIYFAIFEASCSRSHSRRSSAAP